MSDMHFSREQREAWAAETRDSPFNKWLRNQVNKADGGLDLRALHRVALEFGVNPAAYTHLNPGQQRMNIGNKLRKVVPESTYGAMPMARTIDPNIEVASQSVVVSSETTSTLPTDPGRWSEASPRDLLRLHGAIISELRKRGVVRTGNSPLGDYAEHLFSKAFGWTLATNSAAGFDATDSAGLRFQIKTRRLAYDSRGERQLSVIRALPEAKFDMLAAVLFDRNYEVQRAALIPHGVVAQRATHIPHVNGWRFILDDGVWALPGVRDVSSSLVEAAAT